MESQRKSLGIAEAVLGIVEALLGVTRNYEEYHTNYQESAGFSGRLEGFSRDSPVMLEGF